MHKFLAGAGVASRREAEKMIASGKVKVNDQVVRVPGTKIHPKFDRVKVEEKLIKQSGENIYLMLNKPKGYITTVKDEKNRPTVLDLIGNEIQERVYPIGRLDKDTEGLLLISNDGKLAYGLTHPKFEVPKTYRALISGVPNKGELQQLRKGIMLAGKKTFPAKVRLLEDMGATCLMEISIHEGRNQQVRKMFDFIGCPVLNLKRIGLASLKLGPLKPGEYRFLTDFEVERLYESIGSGPGENNKV